MPPLLPFAQLDFAGALALGDGRYLARPAGEPDADADVLVIRTLGAVRAGSRLRRGKPRPLESEPSPDPLAMTPPTLTKALPFADEAAADEWLERVVADDEVTSGAARRGRRDVNRALLAYRVSAPDPYAADIDPPGRDRRSASATGPARSSPTASWTTAPSSCPRRGAAAAAR